MNDDIVETRSNGSQVVRSRRRNIHRGMADSDSPGCTGSDFIEEGDDRGSTTVDSINRQQKTTFDNFQSFTVNECRVALEEFVGGQFCYGSKPTRELEITSCVPVNAFHYILKTFSEIRTLKTRREPYTGGYVDDKDNGVPPSLWDARFEPKELFFDHEFWIRVPHTAKVEKCVPCNGRGLVKCKDCEGNFSCRTCDGYGQDHCKHCQGYRYNKYYTQMTVRFTNKDGIRIVNESDVPKELIAKAGGTVVYQETKPLVQPIVNFPVNQVNQESIDLIRSHVTEIPSERIHAQRQTLYQIPVTEVTYVWRGGHYRFWVYGNERCVYAPDYPQQFFCGCVVL